MSPYYTGAWRLYPTFASFNWSLKGMRPYKDTLVCLIPLLVLLALSSTNSYLAGVFMVNDTALIPSELPDYAPKAETLHEMVKDWGLRSLVQITALGFFLAATLVTGASWYVILRGLKQFKHRGLFALGTLGVGGLVFLYLYAGTSLDPSQSPLNRLMHGIVESRTGIYAGELFDYMYSTGIALLVWVAGAYTAVLIPNYHDDDPDQTTAADEAFLRDRMVMARVTLYTVSVFFCTTLLMVYLVSSWPAIYMTHDHHQEALASLSRYSAVKFGLYYTMVLISIYVPTEVVLRIRARKLARDAGVHASAEEMDTWLKDRGLKLSLLKEAPQTVAVLSPVLAGVTQQLIHVRLICLCLALIGGKLPFDTRSFASYQRTSRISTQSRYASEP